MVLLTFSIDFLFSESLISALILIMLLMWYEARVLTKEEGKLQIWNKIGKEKEPCGDVLELKDSNTSMHMCIYVYVYLCLCICMLILPTTNHWKNLEAKTPQLQRVDLTSWSLPLIQFPITGNKGSLEKWLISGFGQEIYKMSVEYLVMWQKVRHIWFFPLTYLRVAYIMALYL